MLSEISGLFISLIVSILFHEYGHLWYFKYILKKDVNIVFNLKDGINLYTGEEEDYWLLTKNQKKGIYWSGIIFGLIPYLVFIYISWLFIFPLIIYIVGCKTDLKLIFNQN